MEQTHFGPIKSAAATPNDKIPLTVETGTIQAKGLLIRVSEWSDDMVSGGIYYEGKALVDILIRDGELCLSNVRTLETILSSSVATRT